MFELLMGQCQKTSKFRYTTSNTLTGGGTPHHLLLKNVRNRKEGKTYIILTIQVTGCFGEVSTLQAKWTIMKQLYCNTSPHILRHFYSAFSKTFTLVGGDSYEQKHRKRVWATKRP